MGPPIGSHNKIILRWWNVFVMFCLCFNIFVTKRSFGSSLNWLTVNVLSILYSNSIKYLQHIATNKIIAPCRVNPRGVAGIHSMMRMTDTESCQLVLLPFSLSGKTSCFPVISSCYLLEFFVVNEPGVFLCVYKCGRWFFQEIQDVV